MSRIFTHLIAALIALVSLVRCTDGRPSRKQVEMLTQAAPPATALESVTLSQPFGGNALQMAVSGSSLFLAGRVYGFSRWEIGSSPENPVKTFAASEQLDTFSPMGRWVVDWYAAGALSIWGQTAFLSGNVGASVVSMTETTRPREIQRYPAIPANSDTVPSDEAFVYAATVTHPTLPILYGFRRQDYLYTVDLSAGTMRLKSRDAYGSPGEVVCCAMGATIFQNKMYVAFRDRLLIYDMDNAGALVNGQEVPQLQASNVVSTGRYLYVQHQPTSTAAGTTQYAAGIYVFDSSGRNVAFFAAGNPRRFAVSPTDQHFYANLDGVSVKIFRIRWTN
jgi:hypothetical protein